MKKKVLIIYTGGTIGMRSTDKGYMPASGYLAEAMAQIPSLQCDDMPDYVVHEYNPLIDSADATPVLWNRIAQDIKENYMEFDGFLVLHGTDTMAYTSSALSFILENLQKPVMLTGSQVPLCLTKTDARENLINALYLLQHYPYPEVTVYFNNCLFRGNRVTKVNASSYDAFCSPNFPALVKVATNIEIQVAAKKITSSAVLKVCEINPVKITFLTLFPGIDSDYLESLLVANLQAVIIRSYGVGNAPSVNSVLSETLKKLAKKNVLLINASQCLRANVCMQSYAAGRFLFDCGAISANDMTDEAVLTKLFFLFNSGKSLAEIKAAFAINLVGEVGKQRSL